MKKLILMSALLLIGCAAVNPWQPAGGLYRDDVNRFSAELPGDWMRFNSKDVLLITRDGVLLQVIVIERTTAGEELSGSTMKYREGMKATDAAEVMIDKVKGSLKAPFFEVLERRSLEVSNLPAMKILYTYRDTAGLLYQGIAVGVPKGQAFYSLHYVAPKRYCFDHDLDTFEKVVKSVRLL